MRNLFVGLRSIFRSPNADSAQTSHPFIRRCPSSDCLAPPLAIRPFEPDLSRSLSLDSSSFRASLHGSPAGLLEADVGPVRESKVCPSEIEVRNADFSVVKALEEELAPVDLERIDETLAISPDALSDSGNSADCSSASPKAERSSDVDDGSVAWRLFGKESECISADNIASNDIERPARKSLGTRRKINLHHCTEELGSESSDTQEEVSSFDILCEPQSAITISEAKWEASGSLMQDRTSVQPVSAKEDDSQCAYEELRSLVHKRKFPPPLTTYSSESASPDLLPSDSFSLFLRPHRKNGRFVLEEVKVPYQKHLRASRKDGRLRLELVTRTDNEDFVRPRSPRDDFLEEDAELDITSQDEEWEIPQSVTDTDFSMENLQADLDEMQEESDSQIVTTQSMIPVPKKTTSCVGETSSFSGTIGDKQLVRLASEDARELIDSSIPSLTASLNRSKKNVELVNISKNNVEPHHARSLPCVGYKFSAPLMNGDPLSSSNYPLLQCSLKQQILPYHDLSSLPQLLLEKTCCVDTSNVNSSEKKLLLACDFSSGVLPPTGERKQMIAGRLEEGSRLMKSCGLEGGHRSDERVGKSKVGENFEGARSLPSPYQMDLQISFAGICAALRSHDRFYTLPCNKELETSELDNCLKLQLVATNS